ncbi:MAG: nuclear transport factor 2 family protein [Eggerthellaceae bacterium]|nr:nuclear transport factor 2 family protein [Eggerthellaceae bacterium]
MASNDAQVIHALYHSMYRFMIARDVERLGALLDDSFVLVHMMGRRQGKAEFLRCVADGTLAYFDEVEESCPVHVDGDKATLLGRSLVEASPFGASRSTWRLEQDISLERRDGRWLMTRSVASMY